MGEVVDVEIVLAQLKMIYNIRRDVEKMGQERWQK